jgi:hypothetical protein
MAELLKATRGALAEEESNSSSGVILRNLASDSLRLLLQQEAGLLKAYPMALLEIFAEKLPEPKVAGALEAGFDFGELSLMDDDEMLAQVELSKAQQSALHATDAVLSELNTLVSSVQGLRSVQPERNPLRPENYIRALQQVVSATGASAEVRQQWMLHMRELMGKLLAVEYKKMVASLREHGIEPVGYTVLSTPSSGRNSGYGEGQGSNSGYGGGGYRSGSQGGAYAGYSASSHAPVHDQQSANGYGRGMGGANTGWNGVSQHGGGTAAMAPEAEEALLTVGILRQMLAGGDPFDPRSLAMAHSASGQLVHSGPAMLAQVPGGMVQQGFQPGQMGGYVALPSPEDGRAAEAMEDIAQLERLVGRLAGGPQGQVSVLAGSRKQLAQVLVPVQGWTGATGMVGGAPVAAVAGAGGPEEAVDPSVAIALEVVARMVDNIAQDERLLLPVRQAVRTLEPAIRQLVQRDASFFSDDQHPARRLLDELTQRSMAFPSETEPGFSGFMRLVNQGVDHLAASDIGDAAPFGAVLKALHSAWERQDARARAKQEAEQRAQLEAQIATDIRALPDLEGVPIDILEFATGPWAQVIAQARVDLALSTAEDDPEGYWALVPSLLWCSQPSLTSADPEQLDDTMPRLVVKLRKGLKSINYPSLQTSALLQRLVGLHQQAFDRSSLAALVREGAASIAAELDAEGVGASRYAAVGEGGSENSGAEATVTTSAALVEDADPYAGFVIGCWVELLTNGRLVRTQLTWSSPQGTLFLFTGADASTQSMTRRMRDKLAQEGALRVVAATARPTSKGSSPSASGARTRSPSSGNKA